MTQAKDVPSTDCPVAPVARQAIALIAAYERSQIRAHDLAGRAALAAQHEQNALDVQQSGLEDWASLLRAKSGVGAMFQIHLIRTLAESINSRIPSGSEKSKEADRAFEAIDRLCYSVRAYIEQVSGEMAEDAGSEYYMTRALDAHVLAEAALATPAAA